MGSCGYIDAGVGKQMTDYRANEPGAREAQSHADGGERNATTQEGAKDVHAIGSEGHAHADFAGALRDLIAEQSKESDHGKREREAGEAAGQHREETRLLNGG